MVNYSETSPAELYGGKRHRKVKTSRKSSKKNSKKVSKKSSKKSSRKTSKKTSRKSSMSGGKRQMPEFMVKLLDLKKQFKSKHSDIKDGPALTVIAAQALKSNNLNVKSALDKLLDDKKSGSFDKNYRLAQKNIDEKRKKKKSSNK